MAVDELELKNREEEREIDDLVEETKEETEKDLQLYPPQQVEHMRTMTRVIRTIETTVTEELEIRVALDRADSTRTPLPDREELIIPTEGGSRLNEQESVAKKERADIGLQPKKSRWYARYGGIGLVISGLGLLLGQLYSNAEKTVFDILNFTKNERDPGSAPDSLTKAQRDALRLQLTAWRSLPDQKFWARMADRCDRTKPSLQGLVLIMDVVKEASDTVNPPWHWTDLQKACAVDDLVQAYTEFSPQPDQAQVRILCITVCGMKVEDRPLPRRIAAEVVELALYQILTWARNQKNNKENNDGLWAARQTGTADHVSGI